MDGRGGFRQRPRRRWRQRRRQHGLDQLPLLLALDNNHQLSGGHPYWVPFFFVSFTRIISSRSVIHREQAPMSYTPIGGNSCQNPSPAYITSPRLLQTHSGISTS